MYSNKIPHIVCAVLGKPTSRTTVTKAIDLAVENQARLTFAHVINAEFLAAAAPSMTPLSSVYHQLRELGEFSMLILCDRANRRGVENVDYIIREGQIFPQLRQAISEMQPDIFVLGQPRTTEPETLAIPPQELENFIEDVKEDFNITVVPVEIQITT